MAREEIGVSLVSEMGGPWHWDERSILVADAIALLEGHLAETPPEARGTLAIRVDYIPDYDGVGDLALEVAYRRMETQAEADEREARAAEQEALTVRHREARERAAYEALKRKFG